MNIIYVLYFCAGLTTTGCATEQTIQFGNKQACAETLATMRLPENSIAYCLARQQPTAAAPAKDDAPAEEKKP